MTLFFRNNSKLDFFLINTCLLNIKWLFENYKNRLTSYKKRKFIVFVSNLKIGKLFKNKIPDL